MENVLIAFIGQAAHLSYAHMDDPNTYEGWIVLPVHELKAAYLSTVS